MTPFRFLASYHYFKDTDMHSVRHTEFAGIPVELFADSGAFSAYTLGMPLDPGAYIEWAERFEKEIDVFAGPDVIGDPKATAKWTAVMRQRIKTRPVLPAFHLGEDWHHLEEYVADYDYIAFGGLVPFTSNTALLDRWLTAAFKRVPANVRVHGFGVTSLGLMARYPWFSVDSSTWTSAWRYARLHLFDEQKPAQMAALDRRNMKELVAAGPLLRKYGVSARDVHIARSHEPQVLWTAIEAWRRAEVWISRRRESRGGNPLKTNLVLGIKGQQGSSDNLDPALRTHLALGVAEGRAQNGNATQVGPALRTHLALMAGGPDRNGSNVQTSQALKTYLGLAAMGTNASPQAVGPVLRQGAPRTERETPQ